MASLFSRWIGPKRRTKQSPQRYSDSDLEAIRSKYREPEGWHKGARVRRAK